MEAAAEIERLLTFLDLTDGEPMMSFSLGSDPFGFGDLEASRSTMRMMLMRSHHSGRIVIARLAMRFAAWLARGV